MMPCPRYLIPLALCCAWPALVQAADEDARHEQQFRAADADNSRSLSRAEVEQGMPKVILRHFEDIDLDRDEQLTPEELRAMAARQEALREKRRAERLRRMQKR